MEKTDLKKLFLLVLIIFICCIQIVRGVATFHTDSIFCASSTAHIDFDVSLNAGETVVLTRTWFFGNVKIAESDGTTLNPVSNYSSRLTAYRTYGISLSNVTSDDAGNYTYVGTSSVTGNAFAATSTLSVRENVNALCTPDCDNNDINPKCVIPPLCPVQRKYIDAVWTVDGVKYTNEFTCLSNNYGKAYNACAEGDAVTNCYNGPPLCTERKCKDLPQWWCSCDWCIGLVVASGGLLVLSVFVGIIIFCKKRKDIENQICWQISTISIAVLVVIIIAVTGVLAGIVCLCWKEKK